MSQVHVSCYIDLTNMLCNLKAYKCLSNSIDTYFKVKNNLKPVTCHYRLPTHAWSFIPFFTSRLVLERKVYWCDDRLDYIGRVNMNGSDPENIFSKNHWFVPDLLYQPESIAVYGNYVYFVELMGFQVRDRWCYYRPKSLFTVHLLVCNKSLIPIWKYRFQVVYFVELMGFQVRD